MELAVIWETCMQATKTQWTEIHATEAHKSEMYKESISRHFNVIFVVQNVPECTQIICTLKLVTQ